jgi:hypothetical protein
MENEKQGEEIMEKNCISDIVIYNYIYINKEKMFTLKAFIPISHIAKNNDEEKENNELIKYEMEELNKKYIERNYQLFQGIIYYYDSKNNDLLNNIIALIYQIAHKFKNEGFLPIIIIGDKNNLESALYENVENDRYKKIKNIKYLEPSNEIRNSIIQAIELNIKMRRIYQKYEYFKSESKINEEQIISMAMKSKGNIDRCKKCDKVLETSIDTFSKTVILYCNDCLVEKTFPFSEYNIYKKKKKCSKCNKTKDNSYYCYNCKMNLCQECKKTHIQKEEENNNVNHTIYPNNLIEMICLYHKKICYNYCLECKKSICMNCEIESHINHKTEVFDNKDIMKLISRQKRNLKLEKERYELIKDTINDCVKSLKEYFQELIKFKEKEISIKEEMIKEYEMFKYDNILKENIKKLKFGNDATVVYDNKNSWDVKLNNLFEFFNEPIQLIKTKLCLKENMEGPHYLDTKRTLTENNIIDEMNEKITDICPLHKYMEKNYFAVSYNNGLLKIYDDDFNGIPNKIIKEFGKTEGINSLCKSLGHSLLLIGNTKIKKLYLSEDLEEYKIISEIDIQDKFFSSSLEIEAFNCVITNGLNKLTIYDSSNGNLLLEIKDKDEKEFGKEVLFMDKISEKKIIVKICDKFEKMEMSKEETFNDITLHDYSLTEFIKLDSNNSSITNSIFNSKDYDNSHWEIFEFEKKENTIKLKDNHVFEKTLNYIGTINNQYLLLYNENDKQIHLADLTTYFDIIQLKFKYPKPITSYELKRRGDLLDLLVICDGEFIIQCSLNLNRGFLYAVATIKFDKYLIRSRTLSLINISTNNINDKQNTKNSKMNNSIVKIVNFSKNNFLLFAKDNTIYTLKYRKKEKLS